MIVSQRNKFAQFHCKRVQSGCWRVTRRYSCEGGNLDAGLGKFSPLDSRLAGMTDWSLN